MVDRHTVQIEFPTSADVAAQGKTTAIRDERACFVDSATYGGHALALTGEVWFNPLGIWYDEKLGIDFVRKPSVLGCMAKPTNDDIRKLFTEIGCIMEDVSPIALVWELTTS